MRLLVQFSHVAMRRSSNPQGRMRGKRLETAKSRTGHSKGSADD